MPKNHAPVEIDATKLTVEPVADDDPAGVLVRGEDFAAFLSAAAAEHLARPRSRRDRSYALPKLSIAL
jgi:hypothetical protein